MAYPWEISFVILGLDGALTRPTRGIVQSAQSRDLETLSHISLFRSLAVPALDALLYRRNARNTSNSHAADNNNNNNNRPDRLGVTALRHSCRDADWPFC